MLRLADRTDYTMAGLSPRELPEKMQPGRAFAAVTARETQFALLDADTSSQAQVKALGLIGQAAQDATEGVPAEQLPMAMRDLASKVTFAELMATNPPVEPFKPLFGIGGDDVLPLAINLVDIPTFIVGGGSRAGKSTALKALTRSSLDAGVQVALLTPLRSPLRDLANDPGVVASYEGAEITPDAIRQLLGLTDTLVVVDDTSAITDYSVTEELKKLAAPLSVGTLRVIAADGFDEWDRVGGLSWLNELVKRRHGALLEPPTVFNGKPFGLSLNQDILAQPRPVGRALVNLGDGKVTLVQIACEG